MKYRVRLDLSFPDTIGGETDAKLLMAFAKKSSKKAVNIHGGEVNEEISFIDHEICRHDEGLPCTKLERVEIHHN